jgi:hypothetical protein
LSASSSGSVTPKPPASSAAVIPWGQLEQGEGVAGALGDDPVADSLIEPARDDRGQQRPRVRIGQSPKRQPGKTSQVAYRAGIAGAEDDGDRFGVQPAGHKGQGLHRGLIEPLRIVDQAQ